MRIMSLAILLFGLCVCCIFSYAQDQIEDWQMKKTEGEIFEVDYSNSTMTVKYLQSIEDLVYDEIVFKIPPATKITKGDDAITLDDIAVGDHVTVRYYNDKYGFMKIISVTVMV